MVLTKPAFLFGIRLLVANAPRIELWRGTQSNYCCIVLLHLGLRRCPTGDDTHGTNPCSESCVVMLYGSEELIGRRLCGSAHKQNSDIQNGDGQWKYYL